MLVSAHNRDTTTMTVHIQFTLNTLPEGPGVLWNAGGVNVRCADGLTMLSIGESGFITYSTRMDSFKEDCESVSTHDTGLITTGRHTITVRHDGCYATIFVDGEAKATGVAFLPSALMKHWLLSECNEAVPAFGWHLEPLDMEVEKCVVFSGLVPDSELETTQAPVIVKHA